MAATCLIRVGLAVILVVHSLLLSTTTQYVTDLKLPFTKTAVLLLALATAFWRLRSGWPLVPRRGRAAAILGVLVLYLAANALSWARSPFPLASAHEFGNLFAYALLFWLTWQCVRTVGEALFLAAALLGAGAVNGVYGLAQGAGWDLFRGAHGVVATFGNANFFAGYLVVLIPLAVVGAVLCRGLWRVSCAALAVALLACLLLTQTRGAWLACAGEGVLLAALFWVWHRRQGHRGPLPWRYPVLGLAVMAAAAALLVSLRPQAVARVASVFDRGTLTLEPSPAGVRNSVQVRLYLWQGALRLVARKPWLGHGVGTFACVFPDARPSGLHTGGLGHSSDHAHCEYLEILTETGVLGLLLFTALVLACLGLGAAALRAAGADRLVLVLGAFMISLVGLLTHAAFTVDLRWTSGVYLWFLLGVVVALSQPVAAVLPAAGGKARGKRAPPPRGRPLVTLLAVTAATAFAVLATHLWWRPVVASRHMRRGDAAAAAGDHGRAAAEYRQAIAALPICYAAHYALGGLYCGPLRDPAAAEAFRVLGRYAPDYAQLHFNLGVVYCDLKRPHEALPELQRAVQLDPFFKDARLQLGLAFHDTGQADAAQAALTQAIALPPPGGKADRAAYERLLAIHDARQHWDEAVAAAEALVRLDPASADARSNLGVMHAKRGDREQASRCLREAVALAPTSLSCQRNLWVFLRQTGQEAEAARVQEKIQELTQPRGK